MITNPQGRRMTILLLLSGLVTFSSSRLTEAQEGSPPTLNPKHYASPSGKYSLFVDPSDINGRKGGSYRLTREGKEVWSGSRPYTLWDAKVTDDGEAMGYAYSHGWRGYSDAGVKDGVGDFRVVILDDKGKERLDQITKREDSHFFHMPPGPLGAGLFLDTANDRMVVRVADADINRRAEAWWVYGISDGKPLATFRPKQLMSNPEPAQYIIDAKPIAGTPLVLLHWWRYEFGQGGRLGARFTIVGLDGKPVWAMDLADDYRIPGDKEAQNRLMNQVRETGAILRTDPNGQFDLWFVHDKQRVTFAVARDQAKDWKVTEVKKTPYVEPSPERSDETPIPETPLRLLGQIELKAPAAGPAPAIRDVGDFAFDDRGRIAFLRASEDKSIDLVVTDQSGKIVHTLPLDPARAENGRSWTGVTWVGGDRFLLLRDAPNNDKVMEGWWADVANAKVTRVPGFSTSVLSEAAGFADGRFVVKGGLHYFPGGFTGDDNLYAFDPMARPLWKLGQGDHKDQSGLFDVKSVAVTTDGAIAVLDNSRKLVQIFDRDSKHLRTFDLKKAWGREPNYPTGLAADRDGGVLVQDFQGTPPLVRMGADGKVRGEIQPRYPDGQNSRIDDARVAPDGAIWVSDGHALLRLADSGEVDRVLGERPDPNQLGDPVAVTVDPKGWIYAVARRTGAVHVFDPDGRWLRVCLPGPADSPEGLPMPHLTVSDAGDVYLGLGITGDGQYLHFSAEGKRVGVESLGLDDVSQEWYCQPKTGRRWVIGYEQVYLVDAGGKVVRTVTRRADNLWLDKPGEASVAPDGSLAVASRGQDGQAAINLYDPAGEPIRTFPVPESISGQFPRLAFNGKLVVIVGGKEVGLFEASGKPLGRFTPGKDEGAWWTPFLTPTSHELLIFDGRNVLHRFALP